MDYRKAFPSDFLKASDLQDVNGRYFTETWTISGAAVEEVGQDGDRKLVLHFAESEQKMVMNRTNADECGLMFGHDTDGWIGQPVKIYVDPNVRFGNKVTPGLRVAAPDAPQRAANGSAAPAPQAAPPQVVPAPPAQYTRLDPAARFDLDGLIGAVDWMDKTEPGHPQRGEFSDEITARQNANRAALGNGAPAPAPQAAPPAPVAPASPVKAAAAGYDDDDLGDDPFADG